jgi:nucleoid DNA-binding protein
MAKDLNSAQVAKATLESLLNQIGNSMKNNQPVRLPGFGTFKVSERKARKGRNPMTGEEISIQAKKVVRFLPGKKLKTVVDSEN